MRLINKAEILKILPEIDLLKIIRDGFIAYSANEAIIPPVGGMEFESPPGDVHIKYGYIHRQDKYVIKIASGFYDNPKLGIPSSNGLMLVFSKLTGELECILHDEGYLTDVRTAIAGALAAQLLAPRKVDQIGIIGTGTQARLQLSYLKLVTHCRKVSLYGRNKESALDFQRQMSMQGFDVRICDSASEVVEGSKLIVTTTTARKPLFQSSDVRPGTHINAVGADTPGKQELDTALLHRSDWLVADSISQCIDRGECANAIADGSISPSKLTELGYLLTLPDIERSEEAISVVDLTGVAVQDIQIATAVYNQAKLISTQGLQ
ncbi:ornithine cyclodeaminase family protein [Pseudomonas alloputida]|uniref:ornithine cyclodeaminase family protein n=1 Tax=Pseudomonas TaxID=286 RepID=UPI003EECE4C3